MDERLPFLLQVGFYLSVAIGRRLNPLWLRQRLPPLGGEFFERALLDPMTLRPSRETVMISPAVGGEYRAHTSTLLWL